MTIESHPRSIVLQSRDHADPLEAAREYLARGWRPIPVPVGKKGSDTKGWPDLRLTEADLPHSFRTPSNVGLLTGEPSHGLIDIDLDADEASALAHVILPPTDRVHGRPGKSPSHFWYVAEGELPSRIQFKAANGKSLVEVRANGHQTLVPPSMHPSGERLSWIADGEPMRVDLDTLRGATARLAAATLLAYVWPAEGSRQDFVLALSGVLARGGLPQEAAEDLVVAAGEAANDEEIHRARLSAVTSTYDKHARGDLITGIPTLQAYMDDADIENLIRWLDLLAPATQQAPAANPDLADAADQFVLDNRNRLAYDADGEAWWRWNGTHWEEVKQTALDELAKRAMRDVGHRISSASQLRSCQTMAAYDCARTFDCADGLVNFINGTVVAASGELRPHAPDDGLRYCLDYPYAPDVPCPEIETFLGEALAGDADAIEAYMAHIGLALIGDRAFHRALLLIGPRGSGKTTLLALANRVCGQQPWSFASKNLFDEKAEGLWARDTWGGMRLVGLDELPESALRSEGVFKQMTAHSGVSRRSMRQQETIANRWGPKLLFATNDQPRYTDRSGALTARLLTIECPNGREDERTQDKGLFDRLQADVPAFAAACLGAARRVLAVGSYPESERMAALRRKIEQEGDAVKSFVAEQCELCEFKASGWASIKDLYERYQEYCTNNGYRPMAKNKFAGALIERYRELRMMRSRKGRMSATNTASQGIAGIRLLSRSELDGEPYGDRPMPATAPTLFDFAGMIDDGGWAEADA